MAQPISSDIGEGIKDLIRNICKINEGTEKFEQIEKQVLNKVKKCNWMYFLNKREVDEAMQGMADKYIFHNFPQQAQALLEAYKGYVPENTQKSELLNRLNIVKFLLCMSERPTEKFLQNPEEFVVEETKEPEEIDWAEYLNEGIEIAQYNNTENSEESSGDEQEDLNEQDNSTRNTPVARVQIFPNETETIIDFERSREELLNVVQHSWYNQNNFVEKSSSESREANIGLLWEEAYKKESMGLIQLPVTTFISEYKVIREIIWQMFHQHSSTVFKIVINSLEVRNDVSIPSITPPTFKLFIESEFIPHLEVMEYFRDFSKTIEAEDIFSIPQTYRQYNESLQRLLQPIYQKIVKIEDIVREQETTYTLLNLSYDLMNILEPVYLLRNIHKEVVLDFKSNSHFKCAATLLIRLHDSLNYTASKLEQDLKTALFLECLKHYFFIMENWLVKNDLTDVSDEFPIVEINDLSHHLYDFFSLDKSSDVFKCDDKENCNFSFELREETFDVCKENGIMEIIRNAVIHIGRNLHFLRSLRKFFPDDDFQNTIYEEFVNRFLQKLCLYFNVNSDKYVSRHDLIDNFDNKEEVQYKLPIISDEYCKYPTEMDQLDNLVDTTDGFLMLAFEDFFTEKPIKEIQPKQTLFEKISEITKTFYPVINYFENILSDILRERFTVSGLMVKNILIEEYLLKKQFEFLKTLFMFYDNLIYLFYKRFFEQTNKHKDWGNSFRLTFCLQDALTDVYPEFYEKTFVCVKDGWNLCVDSLQACNMITLQYEIQWPLTLIIKKKQIERYKEIFQFILKVKWALYTLNNLFFTDLEPKVKHKKYKKIRSLYTINRLKYLKFVLTNLISGIQHYIFSFAFPKCWQTFDLNFEKANDLLSIIESHSEFITTAHEMVVNVMNCGRKSHAFKELTLCIKTLRYLWMNLEDVTLERLEYCQKTYQMCYDDIMPVIYPVSIF